MKKPPLGSKIPLSSSRMNMGSSVLLKIADINLVKTTYSGALVKSLEFIKISNGLFLLFSDIYPKVTNTEFFTNELFTLYTFASTISGLLVVNSLVS